MLFSLTLAHRKTRVSKINAFNQLCDQKIEQPLADIKPKQY